MARRGFGQVCETTDVPGICPTADMPGDSNDKIRRNLHGRARLAGKS